jgi:hypothetical protein
LTVEAKGMVERLEALIVMEGMGMAVGFVERRVTVREPSALAEPDAVAAGAPGVLPD